MPPPYSHFFEAAFNPVALRKAKIVYNFGLSECNRVYEIVEVFIGRTFNVDLEVDSGSIIP